MEVTCQSLVAMFAVWKESNRNVSLPDSAVKRVTESICQWQKLEALLQSASRHLDDMVRNHIRLSFSKIYMLISHKYDSAGWCGCHRLLEHLPHRYPHVASGAHGNVHPLEEKGSRARPPISFALLHRDEGTGKPTGWTRLSYEHFRVTLCCISWINIKDVCFTVTDLFQCFVAFDSFNSRQRFGIPIGMSCAIERIDDLMESVTTLTELKRLSSCINAILNMASSSLLKRFERKAGQVLDDTDRLTSLDQRDFNSLVKVRGYWIWIISLKYRRALLARTWLLPHYLISLPKKI